MATVRSPLAYLQGLGVGFAAARDIDDLRGGAWQSVYESEAQLDGVIPCCMCSLIGLNAGLLYMDQRIGRDVLREALVGSRYLIAHNAQKKPQPKGDFLKCQEDQNPLGMAAASLCTALSLAAPHQAACQRLKPRLFMGIDVFEFLFNKSAARRQAARQNYRRLPSPFSVHCDSANKLLLMDMVDTEFGRCDDTPSLSTAAGRLQMTS